MEVNFRKGIPLLSPQAAKILNQVEAVLWDNVKKQDVNDCGCGDATHGKY